MADDQAGEQPAEIPPEIQARLLVARLQAEFALNLAAETLASVGRLAEIVRGMADPGSAAALEQLDAVLNELRELSRRNRERFFPPLKASDDG